MTSVFISYSRKNQLIAQQIAHELQARQHDVWLDTSSIRAGEQWDQSIAAAIQAQTAFVILLSPDSVKSAEVENEFNTALSHAKTIFPIYIQATIPKGSFKYKLSRLQCLDYEADPEKCMSELQQALAQLDETVQLGAGQRVDSRINDQVSLFTFWIERLVNARWNGNNQVIFTAPGEEPSCIVLQRNRDGSVSFETRSNPILAGVVMTAQQQSLTLLGWQPANAAYVQTMTIRDETMLNKAANLILLTFMTVYGVDPDESVVVTHHDV